MKSSANRPFQDSFRGQQLDEFIWFDEVTRSKRRFARIASSREFSGARLTAETKDVANRGGERIRRDRVVLAIRDLLCECDEPGKCLCRRSANRSSSAVRTGRKSRIDTKLEQR